MLIPLSDFGLPVIQDFYLPTDFTDEHRFSLCYLCHLWIPISLE